MAHPFPIPKMLRTPIMLPFLVLLSSCMGRTSSNNDTDQECKREGATKEDADGCNTCSCMNGSWTCTSMDCAPACENGDSKPAEDDCNTCTCEDGKWACTEQVCECHSGEIKALTDCNSCTCSDGRWQCTDTACFGECEEGDTRSDGCNACICSDGNWACTEQICEATACGGGMEETCGSDQYCAFTEGEQCGASNVSSICKPRPVNCAAVDEPVCGCDQKTHSNACLAAQQGVGILAAGECD